MAHVGNVFEDALGVAGDVIEAVGDAASSVVNAISDAGAEIGGVLKFIAPIVAVVPGLGTAASVALTAAGAYASGDSIPEAVLGIASSAMPGPVARAAFDAAADITITAAEGGDVGEAAIRACRAAAQSAGGPRAVQAFDAGLAVARGAPVSDSAWALARQYASQQGPATLAAFDAAVAVKNGGDAGDAVLAAARAYLASTGGPTALVAFDAGVAIAAGKTLQEAGFVALKAFVSGNDVGARAVAFLDAMRRARLEGRDLGELLVDELKTEVAQYGIARAGATLGAVIDRWVPSWAQYGSEVLGRHLGVSELMARSAQAVMRDGEPDVVLFELLTKTPFASLVDRFGAKVIASRETNASYAETASAIREETLMLYARLGADDSLSFRATKAALAPAPVAPAPVVRSAPVVRDAPAPVRVSRTGTAGDVALGATVAGACLALVWWARSS